MAKVQGSGAAGAENWHNRKTGKTDYIKKYGEPLKKGTQRGRKGGGPKKK